MNAKLLMAQLGCTLEAAEALVAGSVVVAPIAAVTELESEETLCSYCGKEFTTHAGLVTHLRMKHDA